MFLFSINDGLITSIDTVISSIFCSNFPAEITTVPICWIAVFNFILNSDLPSIFFTMLSYPIYLKVIVLSFSFSSKENFPSIFVVVPFVLLKITFTPINGSRVFSSITIPDIFCDKADEKEIRSTTIDKYFLIFLHFK